MAARSPRMPLAGPAGGAEFSGDTENLYSSEISNWVGVVPSGRIQREHRLRP